MRPSPHLLCALGTVLFFTSAAIADTTTVRPVRDLGISSSLFSGVGPSYHLFFGNGWSGRLTGMIFWLPMNGGYFFTDVGGEVQRDIVRFNRGRLYGLCATMIWYDRKKISGFDPITSQNVETPDRATYVSGAGGLGVELDINPTASVHIDGGARWYAIRHSPSNFNDDQGIAVSMGVGMAWRW